MRATASFPDMRGLGSYALAFATRLQRADRGGRGDTAAFFSKKAKDRIGREALLPPPLKESTQIQRERLGYSASDTLERSGLLKLSIGWSHTSQDTTETGSSDEVAVYHELGVPVKHIPKRSFLAATAREHGMEGFRRYVEGVLKRLP